MIVPAVTEVCLPQAAHSKVKGFPPCGQPSAPAHAGHRNPEGQRAALSHAAQASSLGNWRWNSTSEAGKSRIKQTRGDLHITGQLPSSADGYRLTGR